MARRGRPPGSGNKPKAAAAPSKAAPASRGKGRKRPVAQYEHPKAQRLNNPPVGLVTPKTDPDLGEKKAYAYDPHLDPQLQWAGKAERTSFEVPTVSLHVHERIEPKTIIGAVRRRNGNGAGAQLPLFQQPAENPPLRDALDFYGHRHKWSNRLIAGDSLLVMNSLIEKEGLAGQVQMVYIDPPYGIRYGSNFQPFVNKRDVKDGRDEDLSQEPEMIKAFRDTWELGIHSYLTYLRDRLLLARELLHESGSVFVQISDENVHLVRNLTDEIFGPQNFCSLITFQKTGSIAANLLGTTIDFIIWYARDKGKTEYRQLYLERESGHTSLDRYDMIETPDRKCRRISTTEILENKIPVGRRFQLTSLLSDGESGGEQVFEFSGDKYLPRPGTHWKTTVDGLGKLSISSRIDKMGRVLRYRRYADDFPVIPLSDRWESTQIGIERQYVVQTAEIVIQRCLLMTTDPGDLVFDPTCGSGTTAFVAEQWGRRWITCDTSRVSTALAKQRLMTAVFDYYELARPEEGVGSGFRYKTVPHVTLKSIANNPEIEAIAARFDPQISAKLAQVNDSAALHRIPGAPWTAQSIPRNRREWRPDGTFTPNDAMVENLCVEYWNLARQRREATDRAIQKYADQETLYDRPFVDNSKARVTGPFTVEAVPSPAVRPLAEESVGAYGDTPLQGGASTTADMSIARTGETNRQSEWRSELLKTGVRGKAGQMILFSRVEPLVGCRWLHADAETKPNEAGKDSVREPAAAYGPPMRAVVSFGPEHGPLEQKQVEHAWEEARTLKPAPQFLIFCAFQFDPEAAKDIDELTHGKTGMHFLKVQMNTDLLTDDLKKKRSSNQSFWLIGQPDVELRRRKDGKFEVEVLGFDYYNTKTGEVDSGGQESIAMWMLDPDYDGRSLYPRQVFFPLSGEKDGWSRLARNLKAEIDEELIGQYRGTVSLPFEAGEHKQAAVKIVDIRGIESLKIVALEKR